MNFEALIVRLEAFGSTLPAVVAGVTDEDARWRPASGAWSILEIVSHLVDEEVEDFRQRLKLTLEDPGRPWPGLDPEGAARDRRYNDRVLDEVVRKFTTERRSSITWLRSLREPDWDSAYIHPKFGPISAGMLMAAWPAHDALHLRQMAKRQHEMAARDGAPYDTRYAGEWGP